MFENHLILLSGQDIILMV